jgi:putative chitinase
MSFINYIFSIIYTWFESKDFQAKSFNLDIAKIHELEKKYQTRLKKAGILDSKNRRAMFWAQLAHESGLKPINENLNYSAAGLLKIFPKYFNPVTALQYARKPEMIANKVYANRMGNGPELSGDGWKYRGRGFIQNTGKYQYKKLQYALNVPLLDYPELLLDEPTAMVAAIYFWTQNDLNRHADNDDIKTNTKRINGGLNGIQDRIIKYTLLKQKL